MTEIELTRDKTKIIIARYVDGVKVGEDRFDPISKRARNAICESFGICDEWLILSAEEARSSDRPVRKTVVDPKAEAAKTVTPDDTGYTIRRLEDKRTAPGSITIRDCTSEALLSDHLSGIPTSHVLEWSDYAALCCLDIDYHGGVKPEADWLEQIVYHQLMPKPFCWHLSRSGGLHLFYVASDPFRADELAAVAALRYRTIDGSAGLELKRVVRGPGDATIHWTGYVDSGSAVLGEWFAAEGTSEDARDTWLRDRGIVMDGPTTRKDHTYCPICPTTDEKAREPVCFSEAGCFCFVCEGKGRSMGSRRAGFAPWNAILGAPSSGDVGTMVRNICHWGHAKYVLTERYNMPEPLARKAYSAALKAFHHGRPTELLVSEFDSPRTAKLARVGLTWTSLQDGYSYPAQQIQPMIAMLPAARFVTENSKGETVTKADAAAVAELSQTIDHTDRGYPDIECVHGFKMASVFLGSQGHKTQVTIVNPALTRAGAKYVPVYVPRSERTTEAEAWKTLETVVPRIDRRLVKLALCSFGTAQETRLGMQPMVFIGGISGTAKSSTLQVASGILGAKTHETLYDADTTRFRQSIYSGMSKCAAVVVNEMLKDAANARPARTPRQAMEPLLNLTADSSHHEMYKGTTTMGKVPALWITETVAPLNMREETQIARRLRHIYVEGRKDDWKGTRAEHNVKDLHLIRLASDSVNNACNAILSYVIDQFFALPMTWDQQADAIGVKTIEESADFDDPTPFLIEFFCAVCDAPELEPKAAKRYGKGYKKISRSDGMDEADLGALYSQFADGTGAGWIHSRKLQEKDWSGLLKAPVNVRVDIKDDGVNVFLRFASGPVRNPDLVNDEIVNPETLRVKS